MIGKRHKRNEDTEKVLDLDASMQGSLVFKDPVNIRINGRFEGTLNMKGSLMIGEEAVVNADIVGDTIIISGKVNGSIHAVKELKLVSPGRIVGDIKTPVLSIAEGAVLDGSCKMLSDAKPAAGSSQNIMSAEEVAKYLKVDANMILDWVNSGKLPGTKEGDSWRFNQLKIDEWVLAGKIK